MSTAMVSATNIGVHGALLGGGVSFGFQSTISGTKGAWLPRVLIDMDTKPVPTVRFKAPRGGESAFTFVNTGPGNVEFVILNRNKNHLLSGEHDPNLRFKGEGTVLSPGETYTYGVTHTHDDYFYVGVFRLDEHYTRGDEPPMARVMVQVEAVDPGSVQMVEAGRVTNTAAILDPSALNITLEGHRWVRIFDPLSVDTPLTVAFTSLLQPGQKGLASQRGNNYYIAVNPIGQTVLLVIQPVGWTFANLDAISVYLDGNYVKEAARISETGQGLILVEVETDGSMSNIKLVFYVKGIDTEMLYSNVEESLRIQDAISAAQGTQPIQNVLDLVSPSTAHVAQNPGSGGESFVLVLLAS